VVLSGYLACCVVLVWFGGSVFGFVAVVVVVFWVESGGPETVGWGWGFC